MLSSFSNIIQRDLQRWARLCCLSAAALACLAGIAAAAPATQAVSPIGDWLTGEGGAVVRIARCPGANHGNHALCGHIVGILLDRGSPMPTDWQGRSQCGFELIRPSAPRPGGKVWHGRIINPHNGARYHAEFHVDRTGSLALRGYVGLPIFGETRHWLPFHGAVPASCRLDQAAIASVGRKGHAGAQ